MKAEIKGDSLVLTIPMDKTASKDSKSGKTKIVASTNGGVKTGLMVQDKEVVVSLNAYISNK